MKVCTFKVQTPLGVQKRLGIFLQQNQRFLLDVNLTWARYFEGGNYDPAFRADRLYPASLSQFLKLYQEDAIAKLQENMELGHNLLKTGRGSMDQGGHDIDLARQIPSMAARLDGM